MGNATILIIEKTAIFNVGHICWPDKIIPRAKSVKGAAPAPANLKATKIKLLTNNPKKRAGLIGYGLEIVENIAIKSTPNVYNKNYLETKKNKLGHII